MIKIEHNFQEAWLDIMFDHRIVSDSGVACR